MNTVAKMSIPTALFLVVACGQDSPQPLIPAATATPQLAESPGDAILFLRFDDQLVDDSIYHRPVYFVGTPAFKNGCDDRAMMFEGDEYAYVNGSAGLEPAHVTVEVWMSPKRTLSNNSGFHPLVVKYSGNFWNTVDGYDMWYQDSGGGGRIGFGIGTEYGTIRKHASLWTTLLPSHLHHIVGTFDGANARLYVNGELVATTPHDEPLAYLGGGIRIGGGVYHSYYGGWQYYRGIIDQAAIFPRAMSAEEIQTRYLHCRPNFLVDTTGRGTKDEHSISEP